MEIIRQERHGVSFYACPDPAWSGAAHGFSTRLGGVSPTPWESLNLGASRGDSPANVRENFTRFCAAVGTDVNALVKNHQIHSSRIRPVTRADILSDPAQPGTYEADGLITVEPGVCLTIFSGDCIPILLYDPLRRCIAAAHAGWRGTAAGIAARAAEAMVQDYGCRAEDILAAIGPGIGPCCFETHSDVPEGLRPGLGEEAEELIRPLAAPGKFSVDLKGANACLLRRAGLSPEHIAVCPACTACQLDTFWSHRVQGGQRGSMAAMIQLV
ncbi:MAG: peptidoglycan editing factor PgeF [Lawsonibacter sp.]|jgi:YfiH family protein|nr:peptidoglycan editing factor PgeF [Lawsonibacter sp.]MCI9293714.1 peptidoglycan editing factor PgeF [Lawsonibacter sp.]MDE6899234.1 peptidoglycan editing factor PgeF [Lawsonibacter sp.]